MKTLFLSGIIVLQISIHIYSKIPDGGMNSGNSAPVQQVFMQANNINTAFSTNGIFNLDRITFPTPDAGLIWPVSSTTRKTADYTTGLWVGAKVGSTRELRLAAAFYNSHYTPGNIPVIGQPSPPSVCSDPAWRVYYVQLTDPALVNGGTRTKNAGGRIYTFTYDSWANWPVQKGAPYVEVNNIPGYQPGWNSDRPGIGHTTARPDEISFMVYMDYTNCTNNIHLSEISLPGGTLPLGVEIQQLSFSFFMPNYNDMYFVKWRIINKSSQTWDSTYFAIADDADIGNGADDAAGCDTTRDLGYIYNADNNDPIYGVAPPAIGYSILQSPLKFTGNNNDTVKLPYDTLIGYKLTRMSVYSIFTNGGGQCFGDPSTAEAAYNFMRGMNGCGASKLNPFTMQPTNFTYDGNGCNRFGINNWFDSSSSDRRQFISMGPITMNSQAEQYIVTACIISSGSNNLASLCNLYPNTDLAKQFYFNSFGGAPIGVKQLSSGVPESFQLYQNYPNPFNPVTKIKFAIPPVRTQVIEHVQLKIYDILGREIVNLINEELKPGIYEVEWDGTNYPSGVYFYTMKAGKYFDSKKMILLK